MTIKWRQWLPSEWTSAWSALQALAELPEQRHSKLRDALGALLPFALGGVLAWFYASSDAAPEARAAVLAGLMAVGALLAGFMLSLMMSSGHIEHSDQLSYEDTLAVAQRLKLLMRSQAYTMVSSVLMTLFALAWLVATGHGSEPILAIVTGGFSLLSIVRSILVPLHIYEINEWLLDQVVEARLKATRNR